METLHRGVVSREGPATGDRCRRSGRPRPVVAATKSSARRVACCWVGGREGPIRRVRCRWGSGGNASGRGPHQEQGRKSLRAGVAPAAVRPRFIAPSSHCPSPCRGDVDPGPPGRGRAGHGVCAGSAFCTRASVVWPEPRRVAGTTPRWRRSAPVTREYPQRSLPGAATGRLATPVTTRTTSSNDRPEPSNRSWVPSRIMPGAVEVNLEACITSLRCMT